MTDIDQQIDEYYGYGGLFDRICSGLQRAGKDLENLQVDDLAAVDEFHIRGRQSTVEAAELVTISTTDRVLDVGCGLGGTARHISHSFGCHVTGIDLTTEYVEVGNRLNQMVGLDKTVELQVASALDLPFDDESFDIVWTEHVQMNIPDKLAFYAEIARVVKRGGCFVFHDIFRGDGEPPVYPVPWASDASISHLAAETDIQSIFAEVGLSVTHWSSKVSESVLFFNKVLKMISLKGAPPMGIHLLMGDNASTKLRHIVQNLEQGSITVSMGMAKRA